MGKNHLRIRLYPGPPRKLTVMKAYVYVGLYGYGYLDAGRNVVTLFQVSFQGLPVLFIA